MAEYPLDPFFAIFRKRKSTTTAPESQLPGQGTHSGLSVLQLLVIFVTEHPFRHSLHLNYATSAASLYPLCLPQVVGE